MEGLGTRINMEISKIELAPAKCRRVFFLQGEPWLSLDFSANFSRLNSFVSTRNGDRLVFIRKKLFDDDVDWSRLIASRRETIQNLLCSKLSKLSRILGFKDFSLPRISTFFLKLSSYFQMHLALPLEVFPKSLIQYFSNF